MVTFSRAVKRFRVFLGKLEPPLEIVAYSSGPFFPFRPKQNSFYQTVEIDTDMLSGHRNPPMRDRDNMPPPGPAKYQKGASARVNQNSRPVDNTRTVPWPGGSTRRTGKKTRTPGKT
jgi:hypothetical protein